MKRRHLIAVAIGFAVLTGCGGGEKKDGARETSAEAGGLVIAFDGSPANLDPRVGTDTYAGRIWDMTSSGLVKITPTGDFTGDIAQNWENPDDRTLIFHLNPNAKFHDGRPVRARDFKFTYESLMAENFPSKAKQSGYASVASFEAPDDKTFIIRLKEPNPGIFDNLTYMVVPEGADPNTFAKSPILSGPYKIAEFKTDERVALQAFDQWHGGAPKIKNVTVRIIPDATTRVAELRRGTINFVINSIPLEQVEVFKNNPDFKVQTAPGGAYQYLAFNLHDPILKKKEVRQAIAHAIDRQRIIRDLLRGYGQITESLFPAGHWARAENLTSLPYDKNRAMQLLDAAGHRDPDGPGPRTRFQIVYRTSQDEEMNQQAAMIQQMLSEVGIDMQIRSSEFQTFLEDVKNGRYQMFSLRRLGISDPDFYYTIFHSASLPPDGQNRGFYVNPRVDKLILEGRSTFDRAKRKVAYDQIQRIVADELPYISLYHRDNVAIMRKNVDGFEMYPSGFLLSVPRMTVN